MQDDALYPCVVLRWDDGTPFASRTVSAICAIEVRFLLADDALAQRALVYSMRERAFFTRVGAPCSPNTLASLTYV